MLYDTQKLLTIAQKIEDGDHSANEDFLDTVSYVEEMPASRQGGAMVKHRFWLHSQEEMYHGGLNFFVPVPSFFNLLDDLKVNLKDIYLSKEYKTKQVLKVVLIHQFPSDPIPYYGLGSCEFKLKLDHTDRVDTLPSLIYRYQNAAAMRALASLTIARLYTKL